MENAVARIVILCNSTNYVHPNIEPIKTIHSTRARAHTESRLERKKNETIRFWFDPIFLMH